MKAYLILGAKNTLNKNKARPNTMQTKSSVPQNLQNQKINSQNSNFFHEYPSTCPFTSLKDIKGLNVLIMGLGLHGGGESSARFFLKHGANVTITDLKSEKDLASSLISLKNDTSIDYNAIKFVLGRHEESDFEKADLVIKNPGVKYAGNPYLSRAKHIETDISIFLRFTKAPIIAITGSKGKSSTATALHYGLQKAGFNSFLGGNITFSPLNFLEQTNIHTPVVLELSSWQLSDLRGRKILKPKIAILTKIVPDHLNWYGTMKNYIEDKKLIYKEQETNDYTICAADKWGDLFASETKGQVIRYKNKAFQDQSTIGGWIAENQKAYLSESLISLLQAPTTRAFMPLMGTEDLKNNTDFTKLSPSQIKKDAKLPVLDKLLVPGKHIRENMLLASLAMLILGVKASKTAIIMETFPGVPHRLEFFHLFSKDVLNNSSRGTEDLENLTTNKTNYLFYNDSAATVPEAVIAALDSFAAPIHLICGGTDKNLEFSELSNVISKAKQIYLLEGTGTELLKQAIKKSSVPYLGPFSSLETLLSTLKQNLLKDTTSKEEEIILFSPGATSFGMFSNEFDRGNRFKSLVLDLF